MQEFSVAFGRVSRAAMSANPELKTLVDELLSRAYYNLHAIPISAASETWVKAITAACLQLCLDARVQSLTPRDLVHLFENVIRISEEHLREAKRHAAMASNVFYLKETALDATLVEAADEHEHNTATTTVVGAAVSHTGRVRVPDPSDPIS